MVYLFDLDGTLIDSMKYWAGAILESLDNNNIEYPDDIIKRITPLGKKGIPMFLQSMGISDDKINTVMNERYNAMFRYYEKVILLKPFVKEKLEKLKNDGHSLNVLTASPHPLIDLCLKRNGVFDLFDNVWSCDDFDMSKSDVAIYENVAKRIGVDKSEIVFLDDNIISLKTGKEAGLKVIGVFDDSSKDETKNIKLFADKYIYDFSEL